MPIPQLKIGSHATGRIAYLLLSRAQTRISRRDLQDVGNRRLYCWSPWRCWPTRALSPFTGDANREALRAGRPLSRLFSPTAGVFVPLHDFGGNPFLGQEQAVTERSPRDNLVVSYLLQHPLTLGTSARKARFPLPNRLRQPCPQWQEAPLESGQSGHSYRPRSQTHISPPTPAPPLRHTKSHHRARHRQAV